MNIRTPSQSNGFASIAITKEKSFFFKTLFQVFRKKGVLCFEFDFDVLVLLHN